MALSREPLFNRSTRFVLETSREQKINRLAARLRRESGMRASYSIDVAIPAYLYIARVSNPATTNPDCIVN